MAIEYCFTNKKHPLFYLNDQPELIDVELIQDSIDELVLNKIIQFIKTVNNINHLCTGKIMSTQKFTVPKHIIG